MLPDALYNSNTEFVRQNFTKSFHLESYTFSMSLHTSYVKVFLTSERLFHGKKKRSIDCKILL